MSGWVWEKVDEGRSGSSGDLAKLFKNEDVKNPGVLRVGAPSIDATLLARESIQNSWDAGRALQRRMQERGEGPPDFRVRFIYRSLVGDEKHSVVAALGLHDLADHVKRTKGESRDEVRRKLGLGESDCLDELDESEEPLKLLYLEEAGTTGMGGPWAGDRSQLYLALVSIGFTLKAEGAGGSYGYGKAGLIRASATRTVVAYTAFEQSDDDPGVTRRLLGMTYWGVHQADESRYTGFARLGSHTGDPVVVPMKNDAADQLAERLLIPARSPGDVNSLGSTFLLVDPIVEPDDLVKAVERNWWPALEERLVDVEIVKSDGSVLHPRPMKDETLRAFIEGYRLATGPQDNDPDDHFKKKLSPYRPQGASEAMELGHVALRADLESWSYARSNDGAGDEPEDDAAGVAQHHSLVALVRSPRMVVEYLKAGSQPPYVRGTFVASDDIDDLLRQTEPKAHDAWLAKSEEEGVNPLAPKVAQVVLKRVKAAVREFRKQLKPPPVREQDINLPILNDLFKGILDPTGPRNPAPPVGDPRPIHISVIQNVEEAGDGIRVRAKATFNLTDHYPKDSATVQLGFRAAIDEDGGLGKECPVRIVKKPKHFKTRDRSKGTVGTLVVGPLGRDPLEFEVETESYDPDWTTQLIVSGDTPESLAKKEAKAREEGAKDE